MPVHVCYRSVGVDVGGLVCDTPDGVMVVLDPALPVQEQLAVCAELLNDNEFAQVYDVVSLSA